LSFVTFLSKRLTGSGRTEFSRPAINIAVTSVALSLAVMLISIAVVKGFQNEIRDKVIGFHGDIQVSRYDNNVSYELQAIDGTTGFLPVLKKTHGIRCIQSFSTKAGIIKTNDQIEGVVLKGVGPDYNWDFFRSKLAEGRLPVFQDTIVSDEVMISRETSRRLKLQLGEAVRMYFVNGEEKIPRGRKFKIAGIYETGFGELDKLYVICDINQIRKLNNWQSGQVGGYEILLENFNDINTILPEVYTAIGYNLNAQSVKELYPQIFEWLGLLDANVIIILMLMVLVAAVSMISALLILVLERTPMIGVLKALGSGNGQIRRFFLILAGYILMQGLLWGNVIGIGFMLFQRYTGLITLPQESYYVSTVPIYFNAWYILALNIGTMFVCLLILLLPTYVVSKISPVKAIRFD
jgi:lipoprotein-releasing system permease protein